MAFHIPRFGFPFVPGTAKKSDGEAFNWADWEFIRAKYDLLNETVNNGASILSIRLNGLAALTDHNFVIDIPEGKNLALFNRQLCVTQGAYQVDAISVDSIDLSTGVTNGITAPLNKVSGITATTTLKHKAGGAVNPVVREFGFVDTGEAIGAARAGGSSSVEGVVKILEGPSILRVRKTTTGTFTANLVFVVWEFEGIPVDPVG
jgi:hypothetical protein